VSLLMHTLHVELGERSYPVYIGRGLLADPQLLAGHIAGSQVVIETVAPLYMERVRAALAPGVQVTEIVLPDGEQYKTLATLGDIFDQVMAAGHNRSTTMVALGGGVVGDITGLAAACYQRGVDFLQLPTTLLAQVDSSVGGKKHDRRLLSAAGGGDRYQHAADVARSRVRGRISRGHQVRADLR